MFTWSNLAQNVKVLLIDDIMESILEAEELGFDQFVERLIESGVASSKNHKYVNKVLLRAVEENRSSLVRLLIQKGTDLNAQGGRYGNALQTASYQGHEQVVSLLLDGGAASIEGHEQVVSLLLERGADVNAQGGECSNALQAASDGGHEKVVEMPTVHERIIL